jgi:peroxiredoxin
MDKNKKLPKLSEGSLKALDFIKKGITTAQEMKDKGFNVNSAHLTALVNRGLINALQVEKEFQVVVKRKVNDYSLTEKGKQTKVD